MPTAALRAIPPSTAAVDDNKTGHAIKCRRMYSHPVSVQHDTYPEMKLAGRWAFVLRLNRHGMRLNRHGMLNLQRAESWSAARRTDANGRRTTNPPPQHPTLAAHAAPRAAQQPTHPAPRSSTFTDRSVQQTTRAPYASYKDVLIEMNARLHSNPGRPPSLVLRVQLNYC
jgi:hypothetical protein